MDDITVSNLANAEDGFKFLTLTQPDDQSIKLSFNQKLDLFTGQNAETYSIDDVNPNSAMLANGDSSVLLTFTGLYNANFDLSIAGLQNESQDTTIVSTINFDFEKPLDFRRNHHQ